MKNNNLSTFIIVAGVLVVIIFTVVITINFVPDYESNSYYVKIDEDMNAEIDSINIQNGKLTIKTSGDAAMYCVKSTRTKPKDNALCWKKVVNNAAEISVYSYRKYYIWLKDTEGNISNFISVNSSEDNNG